MQEVDTQVETKGEGEFVLDTNDLFVTEFAGDGQLPPGFSLYLWMERKRKEIEAPFLEHEIDPKDLHEGYGIMVEEMLDDLTGVYKEAGIKIVGDMGVFAPIFIRKSAKKQIGLCFSPYLSESVKYADGLVFPSMTRPVVFVPDKDVGHPPSIGTAYTARHELAHTAGVRYVRVKAGEGPIPSVTVSLGERASETGFLEEAIASRDAEDFMRDRFKSAVIQKARADQNMVSIKKWEIDPFSGKVELFFSRDRESLCM